MEKQTIKVVWPDDYELNYPGETLQSLYYYLCEVEQFMLGDLDPLYFQLENGCKIKFSHYVFHQCFGIGRLSVPELIRSLEIKEEFPMLKAAKQTSRADLQ